MSGPEAQLNAKKLQPRGLSRWMLKSLPPQGEAGHRRLPGCWQLRGPRHLLSQDAAECSPPFYYADLSPFPPHTIPGSEGGHRCWGLGGWGGGV